MAAATPGPDPSGQDQLELIYQEIDRLPEKYRAAVVLCDLRGLTNAEAAQQLGCPEGTLSGRLSRARQRLRDRLVRRGMAPPSGAATAAAAAGWSPMPPALGNLTVRAAMQLAAGRAAGAGAVSVSVASLTEGVIKTMVWKKITVIAAGLLAASAVVVGAGVVATEDWSSLRPPKPDNAGAFGEMSEVEPPPPDEKMFAPDPADEARRKQMSVADDFDPTSVKLMTTRARPGMMLEVEVLEALPGRPIAGRFPVRPDGTICLGYYGDVEVVGLTRKEIKTKIVKHLRRFLSDEVLGLLEYAAGGKPFWVDPADSDRVYVDDDLLGKTSFFREGKASDARDGMVELQVRKLQEKLDQALAELAALKKAQEQ